MSYEALTGQMNGFTFSLAENTYLKENSHGYFLVSEVPLRILRLNQSLFFLLKQLQESGKVTEPANQHPKIKEGQLLRKLLSLVSRGYVKLERTDEQKTCPNVSIIIPVKDQPRDIIECLQSLANLDYPGDKLEVVVVDDGSLNDISNSISAFDVKLIRLEKSQGAAAGRNIGVEHSSGAILAFLDADCIADKTWLREIVPFFEIEGIGAVGGFVDSHYKKSSLDRYEEASSSLNLGKRIIFQDDAKSNFYVPSCNMLVRREAFLATGGFKYGMPVGEDVDFCWRMRDLGYGLLYVPVGKIAHKHRNQLLRMLRRRSEYGTSEAPLYGFHREKKKRLPIPIYAGLSFLSLAAAILLRNPYPLGFIFLFFGLDLHQKSSSLKRFQIAIPLQKISYSALRSNISFSYFASFHLVRYYLILLFGLGFLVRSFWFLGGIVLLLTSLTDYRTKKPNLSYPAFLFFYTLEHLTYQIGVIWGCLKHRQFRAYLPAFG